jgi:hypothetical protein
LRTLLILMLPAVALAVDGIVTNQTTGQPQANVIVTLVQAGQGGMQSLGSVKTDAQGKFTIDKPTADGPVLLQALYGGVTYTKMVQPGTPVTGVALDVYDSTSRPGEAVLNQHMVLLQPNETGLQVNEMFLMRNTGKVTWADASKGTLQFYAPSGHGNIRVMVAGPGGMPVQRPAEPAGPENVYKVVFPIKPGETRFDINYGIETATKQFSGKRVMKGGESRLVIPNGVTLEGDGLEQLGSEPQTQAQIYGVKADSFSVKLSGTGSIKVPSGAESGGAERGQEEDTGQPPLQQTNPRIYEKLPVVLALSAAVLLLGFIVLYRSRA